MKCVVLSEVCLVTLLAMLAGVAHAHGGQYRGPPDVVPPGPGGGQSGRPTGPTTGGPAGPSAPNPSGPATGGPAAPTTGGPSTPAGRRGPTTGGRGAPIGEDLTQWYLWWEFNKDPFIRLRDAVLQGGPQTGSDDFYLGDTRQKAARDSLRATSEDIQARILPALKKAIDSTEQRDINSSCMVAMAKIGQDHAQFRLIDVFTGRLRRPDQEIRETAALSIGIAAIDGEPEFRMLADLALDQGQARAACGGTIGARTRAFATYGLGLMAHRTGKLEIKRRAFAAMKQMLEDGALRDRNIKVAAIQGMAMLDIGTKSDAEQALLAEVLQALETFYLQKVGAGTQLIQAHCPPAIARLIGRQHAQSERYRQLFADDLREQGKVRRSGNEIAESCALALGQLARPHDDVDATRCPDGRYSELLLEAWRQHKDIQTRNFAVLSLGFIGGDRNRTILLQEFDNANNQRKPWCALALGIYSHRRHEAQRANDESIVADRFITATLHQALKDSKDPSLVGALAIGLGLSRATEAADAMRTRMIENQPKEEMAGYLAIGLALMDDKRSIGDLRDVVRASTRRFSLLQQAAIALGKLGDKQVADELRGLLTDGEPNLARLSAIASAIGFIGDRRTIEPLQKLLFDDQLGDLSRAFAAVALGGIADKEPLPWNSKIGVNMNYRAAVETLTNGSSGILDIL